MLRRTFLSWIGLPSILWLKPKYVQISSLEQHGFQITILEQKGSDLIAWIEESIKNDVKTKKYFVIFHYLDYMVRLIIIQNIIIVPQNKIVILHENCLNLPCPADFWH